MILYLIRNEVKKILSTKRLIACVVILILFCSITMLNSFTNYGVYKSDGSYETGYHAIQKNKKYKEELNGILTKKTVSDCIIVYRNILNSPQNYDDFGNFKIKDPKSIEEMAVYSDLADLLTRVYSPLNTFNPKALTEKNLNAMSTKDIMKNRHYNLESILHSKYSEDFLLGKDSIEFGYSQGWQSLFKDLQQISILLIIIVAILIAPVFSREYRFKTVPVLYSSKYGKSKLVTAKIIASVFTASSIYLITITIYSLIKLIIFGFDGYHLFIQSSSAYWLSILPVTFLQAYLILWIVGLIAIIASTVLCLLISMITKRDYIAIIISLLVLLIPMIMADHSFFQQGFFYLPSSLIYYSIFLLPFQYVSLLNYHLNISTFRFIVISMNTLLILFMMKHFMHKKQI